MTDAAAIPESNHRPLIQHPAVLFTIGIAVLLWLAFVVWDASTLISALSAAADPHAAFCAGHQPNTGYNMRDCSKERWDSMFRPGTIALNFWGLAAAIIFAIAAVIPGSWLSIARLTCLSVAASMMLGRCLDIGLGSLFGLAGVFGYSAGLFSFIGVPFTMLMTGGGAFIGAVTAVATFVGFIVGVPSMLFNQILQFESTARIHRYETTGLSGYIVRLMHWVQRKPLPEAPPDESKGARLATLDEIKAIYRPDLPESMAFGHVGGPMFIKTDKHVLVMASTRSGKGVTLIIPHLLRYQGSAFVLDPKGENAKATGRRRAALNDLVHYLDPFGISGKPQSRFNPLSRFTPANMEAESKALAAAFFIGGEKERDHWSTSAQQLLASIILYVYVTPDIPRAKKDMPTVRRLLLGGLDMTLQAMMKIDDADGLLRDLALSFLKTPEKEFGSIVSHAQRQTEILDNPNIIACLSATGPGTEVDFKAWHKGTMTVFLCLAAPKFPTFNRWLRLVLTSALDEMTDTLDPPALPVCFMLDELATLGHLATVENAVGLAAGYGIQLVTIWQDIAQMRDLYKTRWASFVGNSGVRALFNLDDFDSASYWSKFIGGRIEASYSRQEDQYGQSAGQNVGENMRPLFAPDKLMMDFASGKMLVLAQGVRPIITDRIAYWADETLVGSWDDPRPNAPRPSPVPDGPLPAGPAAAPATPQPPPPKPTAKAPPAPAAPVPPTTARRRPPLSKVDLDRLYAAIQAGIIEPPPPN